jgi:HlyD family secretion protein
MTTTLAIDAPRSDWRPPAIAGYIIIFLIFGIIGGWSTIAKLDRAVVAQATVSVESNRKVVQHYEGGIVSEILVKDGQTVENGDVLFRLSDIQARANSEVARNQLDANLALEARLIAERDQASTITWPPEIATRASLPLVARAIADQTTDFQDRRASLEGQVSVLQAKIQQLKTEIQGLAIEKDATEKQVAYIMQELIGLRELRSESLIPLGRLLSMERERTRLEGVVGRAIADQAKAQNAIGETTLQIQQLRQKFQEDTAAAILDVRQKIADLRDKDNVTRDVLQRIDITAPRSGTVQNLKVFSIGQVIRSGEPLLEIVPANDRLVVNAQFSPTEIDSVHAGQEAEIRFPAFQSRTIPVILGKLETVSQDRLVDETTKQPYYLGVVSIDKMAIPPELLPRLRAGMPAEVVVSSGERTVLSYMVSPLLNSLRKSFTER